jgi:hypothetical protein
MQSDESATDDQRDESDDRRDDDQWDDARRHGKDRPDQFNGGIDGMLGECRWGMITMICGPDNGGRVSIGGV